MKYAKTLFMVALLAACNSQSQPPSLLDGTQVPAGFVTGHSGVPFTRDADLTCSYSIALSDQVTTEYKIISAGARQQMLIESYTRADSDIQDKTYVLLDNDSLYVWYDDTSTGMLKAKPSEQIIDGFFPFYSDPNHSPDAFQVQSHCESWSYDASAFERPATVNFGDFDELIIN